MPAVALRLANATLPEPLDADDLLALAAQVGSDVPFFASGRESALARGRGELLEPCPLARGRLGRARVAGRRAEHGRGLRALPAGRRARGSASRSSSAAPFAVPGAAELAALVENDLAAAAEELCPPSRGLRARLLALRRAGRLHERIGLGRLRAVRRRGRRAGGARAARDASCRGSP